MLVHIKRMARAGQRGLYIQIGLGLVLLAYVLKDISFRRLSAQFAQADYRLLAAFAISLLLYYIMRAGRWQLTLQALNYSPSLFRVTVASLAGTLASMVIPGAGELTRCATLQRTDGVPVATGVGLVVAERIVDLLMLAVLCGLTFLLEVNRVGTYLSSLLLTVQEKVTFSTQTNLMLGLLGGVLVAGSYWLWQQKTSFQHSLVNKAVGIGRGVGQGLSAVYRLKKPFLFIALTILSNIQQCVCTYILLLATPATASLPMTASLSILTLSSLGGLAVPTQGGIGTFHFLVSRALVLYGLPLTQGIVVATFLHAVSFGVGLVLSIISFVVVPFLTRRQRT